ncbi:MAG: hypothetical protein AAF720_03955 [Pseudomonadota bacterium]
MVTEVRKIHFGSDDLIEALTTFREQHIDFLPAGRIYIRGVARNGMLRVQVGMTYGARTQNAIFDISDSDVLRVVIHACENLNIPMPRIGEKTISGSEKGICLQIKIDPNASPKDHHVRLGDFLGAKRLETESV